MRSCSLLFKSMSVNNSTIQKMFNMRKAKQHLFLKVSNSRTAFSLLSLASLMGSKYLRIKSLKNVSSCSLSFSQGLSLRQACSCHSRALLGLFSSDVSLSSSSSSLGFDFSLDDEKLSLFSMSSSLSKMDASTSSWPVDDLEPGLFNRKND